MAIIFFQQENETSNDTHELTDSAVIQNPRTHLSNLTTKSDKQQDKKQS